MTELKHQLIEIVRAFREAFQLKQDKADDWGLHSRLLEEEYQELLESKSIEDKADALADIVFVSCGACIDGFSVEFGSYIDDVIFRSERFGIDLLRAVQTVYTSNMSKLCSLEQINQTRDKYASIGVPVEFYPVDDADHTKGFRCVCSIATTGDDGKEYPAGKLLKSVGYQEPDFSYLSEVA